MPLVEAAFKRLFDFAPFIADVVRYLPMSLRRLAHSTVTVHRMESRARFFMDANDAAKNPCSASRGPSRPRKLDSGYKKRMPGRERGPRSNAENGQTHSWSPSSVKSSVS